MPNGNAFQPVVHEKNTFGDLSIFSSFCPLFQPTWANPYFNKSLSP